MMTFLRRALTTILFSLIVAGNVHAARHESSFTSCFIQVLNRLLGRVQAQSAKLAPNIEKRHVYFDSLDELFGAFSNGLVPDLNQPSQREAFELYRRLRFGDPNAYLNATTTEEIAEEINQHPELKKEPFREYQLMTVNRIYPVTSELKSFIDSQLVSAGQVRSNLFQVEANSGYWKKVFQYQEPEVSTVRKLRPHATEEEKSAYRQEIKKIKEQAKQDWERFLDKRIAPAERAFLNDSGVSAQQRARRLYGILKEEQSRMSADKRDIRPISQSIIDLIHTLGYSDPLIAQQLKSADGLERLEAYRKILDQRDAFAMELGFDQHFQQVLHDLGTPVAITTPSGIESEKSLAETLKKLRDSVLTAAQVSSAQTGDSTIRTVRHLSLIESPYRTCLGGSDCSSRSYLTRALDPNYHYFTITNSKGESSGQMTVVLGEGRPMTLKGGSKRKVAFIDKVQNVPLNEIPLMIEAIRKSVKEKGYLLVIPNASGDHNGISNEAGTRAFMEKEVGRIADQRIYGFKPHPHSYSFPKGHSRAEDQLISKAVAPLVLSDGVQMIPGELKSDWRILEDQTPFKLSNLIQSSIDLKNSPKVEDKIRYIHSMVMLQEHGLESDPEFKTVITNWMQDNTQSLQLRKGALLDLWKSEPLGHLLQKFSPAEGLQILQNFLETPRYRDRIRIEKIAAAEFFVLARENKSVRQQLAELFYPQFRQVLHPMLFKILDANEIDNQQAKKLLNDLIAVVVEQDISQLASVLKATSYSSLKKWTEEELPAVVASLFPGEQSFSKAGLRMLYSQDDSLQNFGKKFIEKRPHLAQSRSSLAQLIRENWKESSLTNWVRSEKTDPIIKTEVVLSHFGLKTSLGEDRYEKIIQELPDRQMKMIQDRIKEKTHLGIFRNLSGARQLLDQATLESFNFVSLNFPKKGIQVELGSPQDEPGRGFGENLHEVVLTQPFEIQVTPVTQGQWLLVMGDNPASFKLSGPVHQIDGKSHVVFINRPVENVSWMEAQAYIERMNELDPEYQYRLPTEAEWEYAARAWNSAPYSYGGDPAELDQYGWFSKNSGGITQDVARLKPNAFGLYDMHGNVAEWVQDEWQRQLPEHSINPLVRHDGTYRVYRGGGAKHDPARLRSAQRNYMSPRQSSSYLGFRLVRVPRLARISH